MLSSLSYLVLLSPLANILARPSHIPRYSNPSVLGIRPITLSPPIVPNAPTANNASTYECHVERPVGQPQRQSINTTDCNFLIISILIQADLKNQKSNATGAGGSATKAWAFGTCSVALRVEDGNTKSYSMIDILRWIATIVTSCSDQRPDFLGGTLYTSHEDFRVDVSHQQVDSSSPVALSYPAISTIPVTCWDWDTPGRPRLNPFTQSECDATIVRILARENLEAARRSTTARPFWTRGYDGCTVGLYPRENLQEVYMLLQALQIAAQVLMQCRPHPPDPRGELGGYSLLSKYSIIDVVVYGTGSHIPSILPRGHPVQPAVSAEFSKKALPAEVANSHITNKLSLRAANIECWGLHPGGQHGSEPFSERDCIFLIGRFYRPMDALAIRAWNTNEEVIRTFRTCRIRMGRKPGVGWAVESFSTGDIAYIAQLIIGQCHELGPPYLGGTRDVTPGSAFAVSVKGIRPPLPEAAIPLEVSKGNASLAKHVPPARRISSGLFKRASPTEASPSSTAPLTAHCATLIQRLLHDPGVRARQEFATQEPARHLSFWSCRISFGARPGSGPFRREYFSLYEIVFVANLILDGCWRYGPPHFGGTRDVRQRSAFRVAVLGRSLGGVPVGDAIRGNETELQPASSISTEQTSTGLYGVA